jgi:DegV family protein with EDD domain
VNVANRAIPRVGFVATLETFKYLHRAGRVPAVAEWIGSALKLRMSLGDRDGGVGILGATRTRSQTIKRMLGELERRVGYRKLDVAVFHADAQTRALALRRAVAGRFDCRELLTVELTPVMGAHTGPDVVGLAYHVLEPR